VKPLHLELDPESALELHVFLGEDDGSLPGLRRVLRDYLYENLTIAQLEEIERAKTRGPDERPPAGPSTWKGLS